MTNPLLSRSTLEYELPNFALLKDEHYLPAFEHAVSEHNAQLQAIRDQEDINFENTLIAMERSGDLLQSMIMVFYNKTSSDTNETLQQIEAEIAPRLSNHMDSIRLDPVLFQRLLHLEKNADSMNLDSQSKRLLEKYLEDFRFAGAELTPAQRDRVSKINEQLASLSAEFDKLLLDDSNDLAVELADASRLKGLSDSEIASLSQAAKDRNKAGYVIPLLNYSGHPLLAKLEDRELREEILQRTLSRGSRGNANDTSKVIKQMLSLRKEKAALFGYASYAEYVTSQQTAKSPQNIHEVLRSIAPAAFRNANTELELLQGLMDQEISGEKLQAHDWDRYSEQLKKRDYDVDTTALKPYFELRKVLEAGVFFAAGGLFGLDFRPRPDLVGYNPDNWIYEVFYQDGSACGLYIFDPYARPSKSGGAWMNNLIDQSELLGKKPIVVNNMNIPKPASGQPALMTFDEVNTLFHEFGHTLHGILSNVYYPRFSGTNVERDFVEFPSQVNEMWMLWPEVLANYAVHFETGERLDVSWVEKLNQLDAFNQGFETTHYLQAAILDLALHQNEVPEDLIKFEAEAIENYGLTHKAVPTRYRTNYFAHIFGGGYAAGYYGYIWSEVLDADSVNWFKENGGFTRENGKRFAELLLSQGGSKDSMQMARDFLGREPSIKPLLTRRGLN
jgi:peptidyl-dipeptidase Dcp